MQPFIHLAKLVDSITSLKKLELTNIINSQSFRFFFEGKASSESDLVFIFFLYNCLLSIELLSFILCQKFIFDLIRSQTLVNNYS